MYPESISAITPVPHGTDLAVLIPRVFFDYSYHSEELSSSETNILNAIAKSIEAQKFTPGELNV